MKHVLLCIIGWCLLTYTPLAHSSHTVTLAVGWSKPPYVIQHNRSGFELDLVRQIMARAGYDVEYVFVPFGRSTQLFLDREVEGALTQNRNINELRPYLTEPYIAYQNVAVTVSDRDIELDNIAGLADHSVIAFQRAKDILGLEYQRAANQSPLYTELANQDQQVKMLVQDRVDVAVMDVNIFNYLGKKWLVEPLNEVDIHPLFPATHYSVALRNAKHRQAFNQAWQEFRRSQAYRYLLDSYEFFQPKSMPQTLGSLWHQGASQ